MKSKCYFNFNPYLDLTYYTPVTQMEMLQLHLVHVRDFNSWTKRLTELYQISHSAKDKICLIIKDFNFLCLEGNGAKYPACAHGKFERR